MVAAAVNTLHLVLHTPSTSNQHVLKLSAYFQIAVENNIMFIYPETCGSYTSFEILEIYFFLFSNNREPDWLVPAWINILNENMREIFFSFSIIKAEDSILSRCLYDNINKMSRLVPRTLAIQFNVLSHSFTKAVQAYRTNNNGGKRLKTVRGCWVGLGGWV